MLSAVYEGINIVYYNMMFVAMLENSICIIVKSAIWYYIVLYCTTFYIALYYTTFDTILSVLNIFISHSVGSLYHCVLLILLLLLVSMMLERTRVPSLPVLQ